MMKLFHRFFPKKLRNKLLVTFLLCVLTPILLLNYYVFNEVEKILQKKISLQVNDDLMDMNHSLTELTSTVMKTVILLEQDYVIESIFTDPNTYNSLERQVIIEDKLQSINNSFFLDFPQIYITLLDFHENMYASFQPAETLDFKSIAKQEWFQALNKSDYINYQWNTNDASYVHQDITESPYVLTLYANLLDRNYNPYGMVRISIDYLQWFYETVNRSSATQDYFILTGTGHVVAQSNSNHMLEPSIEELVFDHEEKSGYFKESNSNTMVHYNYIENLDWYLVNIVDLNSLFAETNALKKGFYGVLILITTFFIITTFVISHKVIQPLTFLQAKITDFIYRDKKETITNANFTGEVKILTDSYNELIRHINDLLNKLKIEEREKQAIKFKMLLAQLNPHFLLNTLNTVKWIAIRNNQSDISDICISLGKIMETSLDSKSNLITLKEEIELVHSYIHIQKFRYQDTFDIKIKIEDDLHDVLVPKMSIQMLVENSINHGFYSVEGRWRIVIRAYSISEAFFHLEVEDNGIGFDKTTDYRMHRSRDAIGIENIKERLLLISNSEADFSIIPLDQGTLVRMVIPKSYNEK